MIFDIKCRFCGHKDGEFFIEDWRVKDKVVDESFIGIVDHRCESCESINGNYKKMELEYKSRGGSHTDFESDIKKAEYKKSKFDDIIKKKFKLK